MADAKKLVEIKANKFNGNDVLVSEGATAADLSGALDEAVALKNAAGNPPAAVHVYFPYPDRAGLSGLLVDRGFQFRQVVKNRAEHYQWLDKSRPDMVPPPSSSIIGVTFIVAGLGCVLVIRERRPDGTPARKLKSVSGSVELGETAVSAGFREVQEEVGLDLRAVMAPGAEAELVNGYQFTNARPGAITDTHLCFLVRTRVQLGDDGVASVPASAAADAPLVPVKLALDHKEIAEAKFVSVAELQATLSAPDAGDKILAPEFFSAALRHSVNPPVHIKHAKDERNPSSERYYFASH